MTPLSKKIFALVVIFVAGSVFVFTFLHAAVLPTNPSEVDSGVAPAGAGIASLDNSAHAPARIRIPKIGVDAGVVDVGVGKSGNMAVPYTFTEVGWYRYGAVPGGTGSAVFDGHVDNGLGIPAVFSRLGELEAGDDIYIDTKAGGTLHFKVEEAAAYDAADVPLEKVFSRADVPRLTLITCEGAWIQSKKMYDKRRVVYAVLSTQLGT